ncbi:protein PLANT CADMIUM RESISTANCE 11-like [Andrographis paniculata]|uniref:protein PLANT CADMIUM RESISTANCE 11-like n=1 Tax=Andrographis paniculata TaxID=175694 RepID=UPI0021E84296|nr:protein PLANT CADMIUM RESISTANCE 11-like [Andrographis paniculata]
MAMQQEREGVSGAAEAERLLMEEVTLLDIDMLCSAVVMQADKGKWGKLNGDSEEENLMADCQQYGRGAFRMWEGELVNDCLDDRRIALQSVCCPCYSFGKNMKRAGFGSCFLQGSVLFILFVLALSNLLAFLITRRHSFLYLAISFTVSIGAYRGYCRMLIRKKFNIKDGDGSSDDCAYHLICPCCAQCQESRTLELNVQDAIWHGRGDTICIGSMSDGSKPPSALNSSFVVSTNSPESLSMQKTSDYLVHPPILIQSHI